MRIIYTVSIQILFVIVFVSPICTQTIGYGPIIKKSFTLKQVYLENSIIYEQIDSLIIRSNCENLKNENNKFFIIQFSKENHLYPIENCNTCYFIIFELLSSPVNYDGIVGFFKIKDYYFLVPKDIPDNFYKFTEEKERFTMVRGKYYGTQRFPAWVFLLENNQLKELILMDCW